MNPIQTSLVDPLLTRIRGIGGIDVLLFNPPYVPTEELECVRFLSVSSAIPPTTSFFRLLETQQGGEIGATWAGGLDGMKVTDIILDMLPVSTISIFSQAIMHLWRNRAQDLLHPGGIFYLVAVSENNPQQICERMRNKGFTAEVCQSLSSFSVPRQFKTERNDLLFR